MKGDVAAGVASVLGWFRRLGQRGKLTLGMALALPVMGIAAFLLLGIAAPPAQAVGLSVCTWNASVSRDLSVAANWTATEGICGAGSGQGSALFTNATELVFPSSVPSGGGSPVVDASETVDDIVFDSSYTLTGTAHTLTLDPVYNAGVGIAVTGTATTVTIDASVALGAPQTWQVASGTRLDVAGQVSGSGASLTVGSSGNTGNVILSNGSNDYSGSTTVADGTLEGGAVNALPTTTTLGVASGATFDLHGYDQTVGSLGSSAGTITNNGSSDATLTDRQSSTSTVTAVLSDGSTNKLGLTMAGTGTLTLSGSNT
ncbi:MAG: hypothetical protein ACYCUF_11675, partial [Acidimicrobiales bacterium]